MRSEEASFIINMLEPVSYRLKEDKENTRYLGFIAEDCPDSISSQDKKSINNNNIIAALTKVVKEQQTAIEELRALLSSNLS